MWGRTLEIGIKWTPVSTMYEQCMNNPLWTPNTFTNILRPRQSGRHFADAIFKCLLLNEDLWIQIKISPKFVSKIPKNNIPAFVQMMAWRRPGDNPSS